MCAVMKICKGKGETETAVKAADGVKATAAAPKKEKKKSSGGGVRPVQFEIIAEDVATGEPTVVTTEEIASVVPVTKLDDEVPNTAEVSTAFDASREDFNAFGSANFAPAAPAAAVIATPKTPAKRPTKSAGRGKAANDQDNTLEALEKKNERLEELSAKIERQRKAAERNADTIIESDAPFSAQTRESLHLAEETAQRMDELQRRMAALRESVKSRPAEPKFTPTADHIKTIAELKTEQANLKRHYEVLQRKLEQMESGITGANPRPQGGNKFDENEVKAALVSLRTAIGDLQKQIDSRKE
jgi:hypothetical protein